MQINSTHRSKNIPQARTGAKTFPGHAQEQKTPAFYKTRPFLFENAPKNTCHGNPRQRYCIYSTSAAGYGSTIPTVWYYHPIPMGPSIAPQIPHFVIQIIVLLFRST